MNPRLPMFGVTVRLAFSSIFSSDTNNSDTRGSMASSTVNARYTKRTESVELPQVSSEGFDPTPQEHRPRKRQCSFRMIYVCAMCSMLWAICTGFSTIYAGPATFDMQTRKDSTIKVTDDEVSWIGSVLSIGMVAALPMAVYLAERIGRKETLIFNSIPFTVSWLFIIYAPNVYFLYIGRVLGGWASAVVYAVLPIYAVEIASAETRGLIGASFQTFISIGSLLTMGLGAILPWTWLAMAGLGTVVIALICFCTMPESPRWLVARGMKERAIESIELLHGDHVDAVKECQMIEDSINQQPKVMLSMQNLWQPTIYKPVLISMGQMVFVQFSGSTVILLFSSMILANSKGFLDPKYSTVIVGTVQTLATIFSSFIMDKAGRRILLLVSGILMAASLGTLGAYFYVSSYDKTFETTAGWLPLFAVLFYVAVFSIGYGPIPWLMLSEMVPTRERSLVSGMATLLVSVLSFVAIKTFTDLRQLFDFHGTFWTYAGFCVLSCFFVYFFVPETKGKPLEEIQSIFLRTKKPTTNEIDSNDIIAENISNSSFEISK